MKSDHPIKRRKKLIEIAIPLDDINTASAREKSIRHGHPSTLHLWWARRPLAAARAVLFCQIVDDPSDIPEEFPTEADQEKERSRLFALIKELVTWENTTNQKVLNKARREILRSWERCCSDNSSHPESKELFNAKKLPSFHDPFAGGGAIPLEAQRLGLNSYASDLNPVAILINKAMIEIPPKYAGMKEINPSGQNKTQLIFDKSVGSEGLANDIKYYGKWISEEAKKRLEHLYPKVKITSEIVSKRPDLSAYIGKDLNVIAWLWARTVKSPSPFYSHVDVPLVNSFNLSTKEGKETYIHPIINEDNYEFSVRFGSPTNKEELNKGTKIGRGIFKCLMSGTPIDPKYIKEQAKQENLGERLMAIVAEGDNGRVYIDPLIEHQTIAKEARPSWKPDFEFFQRALGFRVGNYGMSKWSDIFSNRQLNALNVFSDLVTEAKEKIYSDFTNLESSHPEADNQQYKTQYSNDISIYLAFIIDKCADYWSTLSSWNGPWEKMRNTFGRQALPMVWDYAEVNPFSNSTGNWMAMVNWVWKAVERLPSISNGYILQADAQNQSLSQDKIVSTDPPYYDNIGYADLSDFFYVWLRKTLKDIHPKLFTTLTSPKKEELVATPYRNGTKGEANQFFLEGMTQAMRRLSLSVHDGFPITIYYAFKQVEMRGESGTSSTGWETFLSAVIRANLSITATWPMRTELANRMRGTKSNALATSIVLVCEKRKHTARNLSRNEFRRNLREYLPTAIRQLELANIAPVDLAQASIGPGISIFSQANAVIKSDDSKMTVKEALIEINAALDEYLSKDEHQLDSDSQFALTFFESFSYEERSFSDAEGLAKARNVSVKGVERAGILKASAGKVRLLRRQEFESQWSPTRDDRLCSWEATQNLINRLESDGESAAANLLFELKNLIGHDDIVQNCRSLAYRLYNHCDKNNQAEEARSYNSLIIAWPELERLAADQDKNSLKQQTLL